MRLLKKNSSFRNWSPWCFSLYPSSLIHQKVTDLQSLRTNWLPNTTHQFSLSGISVFWPVQVLCRKVTRRKCCWNDRLILWWRNQSQRVWRSSFCQRGCFHTWCPDGKSSVISSTSELTKSLWKSWQRIFKKEVHCYWWSWKVLHFDRVPWKRTFFHHFQQTRKFWRCWCGKVFYGRRPQILFFRFLLLTFWFCWGFWLQLSLLWVCGWLCTLWRKNPFRFFTLK